MFEFLAFTVFGAFWRRALGGYGVERRTVVVPVGIFAVSFPFTASGLYLEGAVAAGLVMLFLLPSHTYSPAMEAFKRYGPFGLGYAVAERYWQTKWNIQGPELDVQESNKWFIDGFSAVGELFLGGSVFAAVYGIFILMSRGLSAFI